MMSPRMKIPENRYIHIWVAVAEMVRRRCGGGNK